MLETAAVKWVLDGEEHSEDENLIDDLFFEGE
jgi:hypothetical protein